GGARRAERARGAKRPSGTGSKFSSFPLPLARVRGKGLLYILYLVPLVEGSVIEASASIPFPSLTPSVTERFERFFCSVTETFSVCDRVCDRPFEMAHSVCDRCLLISRASRAFIVLSTYCR